MAPRRRARKARLPAGPSLRNNAPMPDASLFGRIALKKGLVDEDQLGQALRFQEEVRSLGLDRPLGQILVEDGVLEPEQVELVLRLQRINERAIRDRRFGRIALKNELIDAEQLEAAQAVVQQEGYARPLADVLVARDALSSSAARAIERALERYAEATEGASDARKTDRPTSSTTSRLAASIQVDDETVAETGERHESAERQEERRRRIGDVLFAAVALRDGLVLVPELERALGELADLAEGDGDGDPADLARILRARGVLTAREVADVRSAVDTSRREKLTIPGYEVVDVLGRGVTSIVLKARHEMIGREVAIKLFRAELMAPSEVQSLIDEAKTVAKLRHRNVIELYEVGRVHRRLYYVMELADGPSLYETVKTWGPLPVAEALAAARDVARALTAIEAAGLVHRDVKPRNVLLTTSGQAKLTDLGLAREVDRPDDDPGAIYGTPDTMAPEQVHGDPVDIRTDLYGLGATLYFALTGSPPYAGADPMSVMIAHVQDPVPDPRAKRREVSADTAALVMRLMGKEPVARPASPAEVIQELDNLLTFDLPTADPIEEAGGSAVDV